MGYHSTFMQITHNSTSTANPLTHNLSETQRFSAYPILSVDVIQSSSLQPVKNRVPLVRYLVAHSPDSRLLFHVGDVDVKRSFAVRNLCVMMESDLICSEIDYYNTIFAGLPHSAIDRLHSVLHAAARIITGVRKYDHITSTLRDEIHWLPVTQRITFKLCLIRHYTA